MPGEVTGAETPRVSFIPAQGNAPGWYESGLRPESHAPHPTACRPNQVQKEYIRTDIQKALNSHEIAGFDEFCLAPVPPSQPADPSRASVPRALAVSQAPLTAPRFTNPRILRRTRRTASACSQHRCRSLQNHCSDNLSNVLYQGSTREAQGMHRREPLVQPWCLRCTSLVQQWFRTWSAQRGASRKPAVESRNVNHLDRQG